VIGLSEADASEPEGRRSRRDSRIDRYSKAEFLMPVPISPGEDEVHGRFRKPLGSRFMAAGLRLQFHYNQVPGIRFKVAMRKEYREATLKGIQDGMNARFPSFPRTGSICITEVVEDPVASSETAFSLAARCVIDQAYSLSQVAREQNLSLDTDSP